jgi:SAM-dependent methyltransferase
MICRVCDSKNLELVLDLGIQPWGNHFLKKDQVGKEPTYPLHLVFCHDCTTTQLDHTVPKEVMFSDHTYLSGTTKTLSDHFRKTAKTVDETFFADRKGKSVLDIGSNDGTQLQHYKDFGYDVLGVESSKGTAKIANDKGITTENAFFNQELVRKLGRKFDIINAAGVFFHLEELHSVTAGIRDALKDDGVFVVQFIYMKGMVDNLAFDQIYHEHLLYYTLRNIQTLLSRHDLEMFDATYDPIHGGSIIGYVGHPGKRPISDQLKKLREEERQAETNTIESYRRFAKRVETMKEENLRYLKAAKAAGKRVYGMGAPVKGNTLMNYFGIKADLIQKLIEKNPLRKGLFSPGSHIQIELEDELASPPDVYYVLAWNFKREILRNNQALLDRGVEFYFPVDPDQTKGQTKDQTKTERKLS